jgi:hypothetical protein
MGLFRGEELCFFECIRKFFGCNIYIIQLINCNICEGNTLLSVHLYGSFLRTKIQISKDLL